MAANSNENSPPTETSDTKRKSTIIGVLMMIASGLIFSIHGAMLQIGKSFGYASLQLLVVRGVIQLPLAVFFGMITMQNAQESKQSQSQIPLQLGDIENDEIGAITNIDNNRNHNNHSCHFICHYFNNHRISCKYRILLLEMSLMSKKLWFLVVMRGLMGGLGATCYVYTITALPLGDAIAVVSLYPILTAFTAKLFLKENITIIHYIALFISVIGVILIAQPTIIFKDKNKESNDNDNNVNWAIGYTVGLISACWGSFVFVIIRLAKKANVMLLVISHGFFSILEASIVLIIFSNAFNPPIQSFNMNGIFTSPNILVYILFVGIGMLGFLGQYTQNKAGQLIPAGVSSLLRSSDIVWSYVWEIIFFDTIPNWLTIFGATIVLIAIFLVSYEKLKHLKKEYQNNTSSASGNNHKNAIQLTEKMKSKIKAIHSQTKNTKPKTKYTKIKNHSDIMSVDSPTKSTDSE